MIKVEHKFIEDLNAIEIQRIFANRSIKGKNKILIVGTFNPSEESIVDGKINSAEWFYGRGKNNLWRYLPQSFGSESIKDCEKIKWIEFCNENNIVIIDLIKSFNSDSKLLTFSDKEIQKKILLKGANVKYFNFKNAFKYSKFENVIFTRKTWGREISEFNIIRVNLINYLLKNHSIKSENNIIYCPAPWGDFVKREIEWKEKLKNIN
jgi:hypothetical protein